MNTPTTFQWDYERNPWENNEAALTFSVGVFQWLPKASGKGLKKSKTIRIKGFVAESKRVYEKAAQLCEKLNRERVQADAPPSWLQKQYALPEPPALATQIAADDLMRNRRSNHRKALLAAFASEFKQAGFKKKAATWNKLNPETIQVFNVQCSQWDESYYFNAGIYIRALGAKERVLEHECHVRERIPAHELHGWETWDRWVRLSEFGQPLLKSERETWLDLDPETRIAELRKLIVPLALDWMQSLASIDGIKDYITRSRYPDGRSWVLVDNATAEFLGLK